MRKVPSTVSVDALNRAGIRVVSIDRDAHVLGPEDIVETSGWLLQNSEVINQIQIINGLEKGNITRALKGERVGTIIFKE